MLTSADILSHKPYFSRKKKISEEGSHEELMKKNGHYAKLYNLQAKWHKMV